MSQEFYDGTNVCDTQNDFNVAFKKALKQNNKDAEKKALPWISVLTVIMVIFTVWAIILAMQVEKGSKRLVHFVLAFLFSPVYVFSYYLTNLRTGQDTTTYGFRFY